jgi:hypothetical protein
MSHVNFLVNPYRSSKRSIGQYVLGHERESGRAGHFGIDFLKISCVLKLR